VSTWDSPIEEASDIWTKAAMSELVVDLVKVEGNYMWMALVIWVPEVDGNELEVRKRTQ
jgi:hypothetical protein